MSAPAPAPAADAAATGPKKKSKMMLLVICVVFIGAGAATPVLAPGLFGKPPTEEEAKATKKKKDKDAKTAIIPFGDLTVNLAEDRMTRYLRVKLAVVVEADSEKHMTEELTKFKPALKSKSLAHLAGKTLKDVGGSQGLQRVQRELFERFEEVLPTDLGHHLKAVLCEEYIIQ